MKKIVGLDMATKSTGWSFFDGEDLKGYGILKADEKYIYARLLTMKSQIRETLESHQPDLVVMEEVPISNVGNLDVGKNLCILQGLTIGVCDDLGIAFMTMNPSVWRKEMKIHRTVYTCTKCGTSFEGKSGVKKLECRECENTSFRQFRKVQMNKRNELKERAVDEVNLLFGLDLAFKKNSNKSEDDIAEAILIGLSKVKGIGENNGDL